VATIKSWESGSFNLLILYTDGTVRCTGEPFDGKCNLPDADTFSVGEGVTDLAMGWENGNAVVNGRVVAWGSPGSSVLELPADALNGVIDVAAGSAHSVALKRINANTTRLIRWGRDAFGLSNIPDRSDVVAVSASYLHVLALTTSGGVLFWGLNTTAQGAVPPEAASGIVAIAAGDYHSMALTASGRVLAWGGLNGQSSVPVEAQSNVIKIDAGQNYCLALRSDGSVIAWGEYARTNENGSEIGPTEFLPMPRTFDGMTSGVIDIAALENSFIARKRDGSVVAFGVGNFRAFDFPDAI
jgi:alpha-tubulin suppressor-like RCC1 family protein